MTSASNLLPRAALIVTGLAVTCMGCGDPAETVSTRVRPSILVVLVDALRPDHLGSYGYPRPTSPRLDELSLESVRFTEARAVSSWTKPSIPSLFTSLYPSQHGVFEGNAHGEGGKLESDIFSRDAFTVAEALNSCGYSTGAVVHNAHLRAEFGYDQGFEHYEEVSARTPEMIDRLRDWLTRARDTERPFFAYLHLLDAHWPYEPPADAAALLGLEPTSYDDSAMRDAFNRGYVELPPEQLATFITRYDAEIRGTDTALASLLDELRDDPDLVILFTADHGEAFLEHGYLGHGRDLYEESVRVPLLLRLPDGRAAGSVVDRRVSTLDVMPTLLDLANCDPPGLAGTLQGRSLLSLLDSPGEGDPPFLAETRHGKTFRQAVWHDNWKLIHTRRLRFERQAAEANGQVKAGPESLVGIRVEVEGVRVDGGRFIADEIELEEPGDDDDEVSGVLESIDPAGSRARIAGFEVDLEDAVLLDEDRRMTGYESFAPGALVKVEGVALDAGRLEADKLRLRTGGTDQEIEGLIRSAEWTDDGRAAVLTIAGLQVIVDAEDLEPLGGPAATAARTGEPASEIELYDLATDPGETVDLASRESEKVDELMDLLETMRDSMKATALAAPDRVTIDAQTIEKLRGLGYIE